VNILTVVSHFKKIFAHLTSNGNDESNTFSLKLMEFICYELNLNCVCDWQLSKSWHSACD